MYARVSILLDYYYISLSPLQIGPREDDDSDSEKRPRSDSKLKLLKDTVGAIREKKYVKGKERKDRRIL